MVTKEELGLWGRFKKWFGGLPGAIRVIYFVGSSSYLSMMVTDLEALDFWWVKYLSLPLTVGINVLQYYIMKEKK